MTDSGLRQALFKGVRGVLPAIVLALGLAGCASEGARNDSLWDEVFSLGAALVPGGEDPVTTAPELTPELLAGVDVPLIRSERISEGTSGTQYAAVARRVRGAEQITWAGAGAFTLTTRDGVLVGLRGSLDDMIWADADGVLRALAAGGGQASRRYMFLQGNAERLPVEMRCTLRRTGSETLQIVGQRRASIRLEERCEGPLGQIRNLYWRDPGTGVLWKSEQWAGFDNGYLRIERIIP